MRCREMDLPPYSLLNGSSSSNLLGGGGDMAGHMATQWEPQQQEGGGLGMQVLRSSFSAICPTLSGPSHTGLLSCVRLPSCMSHIRSHDQKPAGVARRVRPLAANCFPRMIQSVHDRAWHRQWHHDELCVISCLVRHARGSAPYANEVRFADVSTAVTQGMSTQPPPGLGSRPASAGGPSPAKGPGQSLAQALLDTGITTAHAIDGAHCGPWRTL